MGGNIFNNTRRYDREEYLDMESEVIDKLYDNIFIFVEVHYLRYASIVQAIGAYHTKQSFGDLDLIINSKYLKSNYIDIIKTIFKLSASNFSKNGNVVSISYKAFQIDLIITKDEEFQSSLAYFKFNDAGMIIGKIARAYYGIRYGHRGLDISIQDKFNKLGEIFLTTNTRVIHNLLGLNHDEWLIGFDTLEDMFKWASNTPLFNKNIFEYDNMNSTDRIRERKRTTYSLFLDWMEKQDNLTECDYQDISLKRGYTLKEPMFTDIICKEFPHVMIEYNTIIKNHEDNIVFKENFNGDIVGELTGLSGKELGVFMSWAKDAISRTGMKFMFLKYHQHTCNCMILSMYNHYQQGWVWLAVPEDIATKFVRNL